jgi:hypothetical protein
VVVYEIDFLPSGSGSSAGFPSAITARFTIDGEDDDAIVILDGGTARTGGAIVDHIRTYYDSHTVDLVIATRTNADDLAGLAVVLDELEVRELLIHQPRRHGADESAGALDAVDRLLEMARRRGTTVTEPFTGLFRFNGQLAILGPSQTYYQQLLREPGADRNGRHVRSRVKGVLRRGLARLPVETLSDDADVRPTDNMSVVTLIQTSGHRLLFTAAAGIPALQDAADFYESWYGDFATLPVHFLQAPHYGRPESLGPSVLNQILGPPGTPNNDSCVAFISTPPRIEDLPSPRIVAALRRRGCAVTATAGRASCHSVGGPPRPEWTSLAPIER